MNAEFNEMVVRHWEIPLTSFLKGRIRQEYRLKASSSSCIISGVGGF